MITYLSAFEAKKAIWIVAKPRQEHITAIAWLNESTNCEFFLIKIADSLPAPLMTLIVGPSEMARQASSTKKSYSQLHQLRYQFWTGLLELSKKQHSLFHAVIPKETNSIGTSAGKSGITYGYLLTKDSVRVEIYIDRGKDKHQENIDIFQALLDNKEAIEKAFEDQLEWVNPEQQRSCFIRKEYKQGGWKSDQSEWPRIYEIMIKNMIKLEAATKKIISNLDL